ncbi:hypothetical protein BN903_105 [Halorubrum sp. AJ67]|nr:hypothetical protein BN903_105 [Halorubrum sp. AJ67]
MDLRVGTYQISDLSGCRALDLQADHIAVRDDPSGVVGVVDDREPL